MQNLNSFSTFKKNSHPLRVLIDLVPPIPFNEIFITPKNIIRLFSFIGLLSTQGKILLMILSIGY